MVVVPAVLALIFSLCASLSAVVIVVILLLSQMTIGNFQTSERIIMRSSTSKTVTFLLPPFFGSLLLIIWREDCG